MCCSPADVAAACTAWVVDWLAARSKQLAVALPSDTEMTRLATWIGISGVPER
jgi:hypothetical protein